MRKPIVVLVTVGAVSVIGYKFFLSDRQEKMSETAKLIHNAENSVRTADASLQKAKMSFEKVPFNKYKVASNQVHKPY